MDKSPEAFRTISEVADTLETPAHVLRFWETRFPQIRPVKRAGGRRYYRPSDVALLSGIKRLLHDEGMTIRGVQKILREQGIRHVAALGAGQTAAGDDATTIEAELSAALGTAEPDALPAAEAETAQVIALETVLARGDRGAPPAQRSLWEDGQDTPPDAASPDGTAGAAPDPGTAVAPVPEAPMVTDAEEAPPAEIAAASDAPAAPAGTASNADPSTEPVASESEPPEVGPTLATRLRSLPRGSLAGEAEAVADLQDRILTLRSSLAEAAGRRIRGS